jgi:hypothetical protein
VRYDARRWNLSIDTLILALRAEGCDATYPRYPLLHQQPFFTEGHFASVARLGEASHGPVPIYQPDALPLTEKANGELIKLPSFPSAEAELLDSYALAFEKVLRHADEIEATVKMAQPLSATIEHGLDGNAPS